MARIIVINSSVESIVVNIKIVGLINADQWQYLKYSSNEVSTVIGT